MMRSSKGAIGVALALAGVCGVSSASAQGGKYPAMAAPGEYLMERAAEIRLARSAAPASISGDATVLVLGPRGYETAVAGSNGFVCWVGRSWTAAFDWAEFWNPKVRAADCMNPQAARSMVPLALLRSSLVMAGRSKAEVLSAVRLGYANGTLPTLESGAMDYMMSRASYLTDDGDHNSPHIMFMTTGVSAADWGSNVEGSPVMSAPYWFFTPQEQAQTKGLPPLNVFLVGSAQWSDGTPSNGHEHDRAGAARRGR